MKKTLCLDFDGVLHSYTSGWQGARVIPDPPVPGAMEFLIRAVDLFDVCIYSSRSKNWLARWAMRRWLFQHLAETFMQEGWSSVEPFTHHDVLEAAEDDAMEVLMRIRFPWFKPAAHLTIDDRAWQFRGSFPSHGEILGFRPWNK